VLEVTQNPKAWSARRCQFLSSCTTTSSGFHRQNEDGSTTLENGRLAPFRNFDELGNQLARPCTLLIDSEQIEFGDALDPEFCDMAKDEIERFRREILERTCNREDAEKITDQDLVREVMNTVGKEDRLGESIRCVVSIAMLTEGWDASTVTHVLGVRAFGTQLLCEQVIGPALRRQSYELNETTGFQRTRRSGCLNLSEQEIAAVGDWARSRSVDGLMPHEIAVSVRSSAQVDRAQHALEVSGVVLKVLDQGSSHYWQRLRCHDAAIKRHRISGGGGDGLRCRDHPLQSRIETVTDNSDLEDVYNTERHLLYVAWTRRGTSGW